MRIARDHTKVWFAAIPPGNPIFLEADRILHAQELEKRGAPVRPRGARELRPSVARGLSNASIKRTPDGRKIPFPSKLRECGILYIQTGLRGNTMSRSRQKKRCPSIWSSIPALGPTIIKNPGMERKAPLGKDPKKAIELANVLNSKYRIQLEQKATRLEAALDFGSPRFEPALTKFVDKYILDYRIKPSTAALLQQRRDRLTKRLGDVQVAALDTQMLREAIASSSQFEQTK